MRTASEKLAIIRLVEDSALSVRRTLREIKVSRSSFYRWYVAYQQDGLEGLGNQGRTFLQSDINTHQKRKDQTKDHRETPFALSTTRRVI